MLICLILVEILFLFGINQYENQVNHRIEKSLEIKSTSSRLDSLSNYFDINRLFSSNNILMDVRR